MSNKKSRKLINIMLSALMILGVSTQSYSEDKPEYGKNGVAYVLLSTDFSEPGVYRFNDFNGDVRSNYATKNQDEKKPIFKINTITGKVSGLAANQFNNVFLLSAIEGDGFKDAEPGWLPTGISFDENSSIYISAAKPDEGGAAHYIRKGCPHISNWDSRTGSYWKHNMSIGSYGPYKYVVTFGGPKGVKFFNGADGTTGTPVWDGTYTTSGGISTGAAIKHPTDERKIILPSHFGALSYYLYGTKNEPAIQGLPMDGTNGRDKYIFTDATGAGVFAGDSNHKARSMFGCIVKRFYQKRENSLNLYTGEDKTTDSGVPENKPPMKQTQSNVLKTVDVKVREAYGKLCGDNCIDGGEIAGGDVETALSTVTVVTSTKGYRYGFNPLGVYRKADTSDQINAALRVVTPNGRTETIDISATKAGDEYKYGARITNKKYLEEAQITPSAIKTIGVSTKYSDDGNDFIYGSGADYFVVQDSWWGVGGLAYEYYKGTDGNSGKIVKIDYTNADGQTASQTLGDLEGKVDDIAIDGNGYLYALITEEDISDEDMSKISVYADPSTNKALVGKEELKIEYSGWKRDKTKVENDETQNDGVEDVDDGDEKEGDYKIATVKQAVYKSVKRYHQAENTLGDEKDRGSIFVGYDTWTNNLKITSSGYTWDYPLWRQEEGTKASSIPAELAVVNVADAPESVDGTNKHYIAITEATDESGAILTDYINDQSIEEEQSLTFKIEGYKPKVDGKNTPLKNIGDLTITGNTKLTDVKLNSIFNKDVEVEGNICFDEDGDTNKSGFTSRMFEATGHQTSVEWYVARVEDTTPVPLSSAKIIKSFPATTTSSLDNEYNLFECKFSEPGRYIIQAKVTYNCFSNLGNTGIKPNQLTVSQETFTTEPKLINVYAKSLELNKTPSYITNIDIKFDKKLFGDVSEADTGVMLDTVEGLPEAIIGSFTITFEAQFYSEANSYDNNYLKTNNGIGVWDYLYYQQLYKENKAYIPSIIVPEINRGDHVYNYKGGNNLSTSYDPNIYNPGKAKATSVAGTYLAGTQVNGEPNKEDKSFIQWALIMRPVTPQGSFSLQENTTFTRGSTVITSGTCASPTVNFEDLGNRKYKVTIPVNAIDTKIATPRDPGSYTLDLEIIYPRVTWLNNDLGANLNDKHDYFSSVVPYTESCKAAPIHVLSKLEISGSNGAVNQSFKHDSNTEIEEDGKTSKIFNIQPHITICARDKEIASFTDQTVNMPYIQTTGEPSVNGEFDYTIMDNNPFFSVKRLPKESPNKITKSEALGATDVVLQKLMSSAGFNIIKKDENEEKYNKYYKENTEYRISEGEVKKDVIGPNKNNPTEFYSSNSDSFCFDDEWRVSLVYNVKLNPLTPKVFEPTGTAGQLPNKLNKTNYVLDKENWVGILNYGVKGSFFDGYGVDGTYAEHKLYNKDVFIEGYSEKGKDLTNDPNIIKFDPKPYLERIDNDPPTIMVELVSQTDNRRWEIQLVEGVNDKVSSASKKSDLAPSNLCVNCYNLKNESSPIEGMSWNNIEVPGTTNYYNKTFNNIPPSDCNSIATVTTYISDSKALPSFRRAGRLLVNVDIFDNCGYLPLSEAKIKIEQNGKSLFEDDNNNDGKTINPEASHGADGNIINFSKKPRGVFTVNLPMQVAPEENQPQITISVKAKDHAGNERELVIPVKLVESSFETRVLETKEERK